MAVRKIVAGDNISLDEDPVLELLTVKVTGLGVFARLADLAANAGASLVGFLQAGAGAVARTVQTRLRDTVSVKDFGAVGDGVADDTAAFQAAVTASDDVYVPKGTYKLTAKIVMRVASRIYGQAERATFIFGTHAGVLFEYPYLSSDTHLRKLYFYGTGCTGVAVAATAGPFQGYLPRMRMKYCHFGFDMAYGINAPLINSHIDSCTFGHTGPAGVSAGWVGTLVAIRSVHDGANYVNLNSVNRCIFKAGTSTQAAVYLDAGGVFNFNHCDFEFGGKAVGAVNLSVLRFNGCWFEAETTATGVVELGQTLGHTVFEGCSISCNVDRFLQWASGWNTNAITFRNNGIGLGAASYLQYDVSTASYNAVTDGRFCFENNYVSGGAAANKLTNKVNLGTKEATKGWAIISTATPGAIIASSDPGLTIAYSGVGNVLLGTSHPVASTIAKMCVSATVGAAAGIDATVTAYGITDTSTIRVVARKAAAAFDTTVNVTWHGV